MRLKSLRALERKVRRSRKKVATLVEKCVAEGIKSDHAALLLVNGQKAIARADEILRKGKE